METTPWLPLAAHVRLPARSRFATGSLTDPHAHLPIAGPFHFDEAPQPAGLPSLPDGRSRIQGRAHLRAGIVSSVASCSSMAPLKVLSPILLCVRKLVTVKNQFASRCRNAPWQTNWLCAIPVDVQFDYCRHSFQWQQLGQALRFISSCSVTSRPKQPRPKAQFACSCFRESAKQSAFRNHMNVLLRRNAD